MEALRNLWRFLTLPARRGAGLRGAGRRTICNALQRVELYTTLPAKIFASEVAQWLACWAHNPKVPGSKPGFAIFVPAGAMPIISESFQFSRMIPEGNPRVQRCKRCNLVCALGAKKRAAQVARPPETSWLARCINFLCLIVR